MTKPRFLDSDRLLPAEPGVRAIARELYASVAELPIISPHGHCDAGWFASDAAFGNAAALLLQPDHYLLRMLHSQGVSLDALGVGKAAADPRESWRLFAERYHLFRAAPSRIWLDWVFAEVFGLAVRLDAETSDTISTRSPQRLPPHHFARARCSTGSASKFSQRPKARSTASRITARSAPAPGRAGSSPPIAPIR